MAVRAVSEVGKSTGEVRQWLEEVKNAVAWGMFDHGWGLSWEELSKAGGEKLEPDNQML